MGGIQLDRYRLIAHDDGEALATAPAVRGRSVYSAFDRAGQRLPTTCGGSSICGMCRVRVVSGRVEPPQVAPDEAALLERVAPGEGLRLACRIRMADGESEVVLEVDRGRWERSRRRGSRSAVSSE